MMDSEATSPPAEIPLQKRPGRLRRLLSIPAKLGRLFREHGLREGIGMLVNFAKDRRGDRSFGVKTNRSYTLKEHGVDDENYVDYSPITYAALRATIRALPRELNNEDVFIDFGAGKGRVLLEAASRPLKRVIGIEFMPELADEAEKNIEIARARGRLQCETVDVSRQDATEYAIPADATVLHFYNPFRGPVLDRVIENFAESLREHPRPVIVLFANPDDFDRILKVGSPIPLEWVKSEEIVLWPFQRKNDDELGNVYRNYLIDPS
ncbi:MAG: precorrin-6B methylase 2 [Verrucomicrobiales bacterium]|jgi:precorrin-6B methylase 2